MKWYNLQHVISNLYFLFYLSVYGYILYFRPKASCFNCGGEHMISECKEVKDFQRIKRNKAEFLDKSSQNQN